MKHVKEVDITRKLPALSEVEITRKLLVPPEAEITGNLPTLPKLEINIKVTTPLRCEVNRKVTDPPRTGDNMKVTGPPRREDNTKVTDQITIGENIQYHRMQMRLLLVMFVNYLSVLFAYQPTSNQQVRSRRSAYASANPEDEVNGALKDMNTS